MPAGASLCSPSLSGLFFLWCCPPHFFSKFFFRYKGMADVISTCEAGGEACDSRGGGGIPQDSSGDGGGPWDRGGR